MDGMCTMKRVPAKKEEKKKEKEDDKKAKKPASPRPSGSDKKSDSGYVWV